MLAILCSNPQVGDTGIISFDNLFNAYSPSPLSLRNTNKFVAPYWADFDSRGTGAIYYRQTSNPSLLDRATSEIRDAFSLDEYFEITHLFIATWDAVGYYSRKTDKVLNFITTQHITMWETATSCQAQLNVCQNITTD